MEQVGMVKNIIGQKAEVEIKRISGCSGKCKTCSGCDTPSNLLILKNDIGAQIGDMVKVRGQMKSIFKYAMIVYMIPFVFLMLGVLVGIVGFKSLGMKDYELKGFLLGIVFMALGYILVRKIDSNIAKREDETITIIEILED